MRFFLILALLLPALPLLAQDTAVDSTETVIFEHYAHNPRMDHPFGLSVNLGGPSILLSLSADYFVTPALQLEAGAGLIGVFGGVKYHLRGSRYEKPWTPYAGAFAVRIPEINFFTTTDARALGYFPLGIQYLSYGGFLFAAELAGVIVGSKADGPPIWGGIKFGYHF